MIGGVTTIEYREVTDEALVGFNDPTLRRVGVPGAGGDKDKKIKKSDRITVDPLADAAYKEGSLLTYAADLKRPLLLLHGTADDNVYFSHSARLSAALFRAGRAHEFIPLVGFTHMVPDPGVNRRLYERIARFFVERLQLRTGCE